MIAAGSPVVIGHDALVAFCTDILAAADVSREEARKVASRLAEANLTGHDSHGVGRVPRYVQMLEQGLVEAGQSVSVVTGSETHLLLDGNSGFGQVIGEEAVAMGLRPCSGPRHRNRGLAQHRSSRPRWRLGAYGCSAGLRLDSHG